MRKEKVVALLEIETFAHATEDREKVLKAIFNLIPENIRDHLKDNILYVNLQGHHGNPITLYRLKVEGDQAQEIARNIFSKMESFDSKLLISSLEDRSDKRSLYLRLDKQCAYLGLFKLLQGDDVIKIRVCFLPHIRGIEKIKQALSALGLKP